MLELSKIKYQERPTPNRIKCTDTLGTLTMHCELTVDNDNPMQAGYAKNQIAERIWRMAYSDLHKPLMELQMMAKINAPPQARMRVEELCEQLNALLTPKSPNADIRHGDKL
jgi:hypothetical protein